jgi:hypothetical protein
MAKLTKADIIKKIIDLNPEDPGSLTSQYITKKNGKKLGPYWIFQTSSSGHKISIRVPVNEVDEIEDYIQKMKNKQKVQVKKSTKLLDTYMDTIADISPGATPPTPSTKKD